MCVSFFTNHISFSLILLLSPTPVIEWTKRTEKLPKRANLKNYGKRLTINNIEEEDDGKYTCEARNSVGDTVHYFNVMVEGK